MNQSDRMLIGLTTTDIIDPIYHDNTRTEFRLQRDNIYDADIRLGGLGTVSVGAGATYLYSAGVEAIISAIHIYNGSDLIDEVVDCHQVSAFMNMLRSNGKNNNITRATSSTSMGYYIQDTDADGDPIPILRQTQIEENGAASTNATLTFLGVVNLGKLLGFFKGAPNVNTYILKDFRIVIEYRPATDVGFIFRGDTTAVTSYSPTQPQLYVDKMVGINPKEAMNDYSFSYQSMEQDQMYVPDVNPVSVRLNAFNGKLLTRVLLINSDQTTIFNDANDFFKFDASSAQEEEKIQFIINGRPLWNYDGIDSADRKLQKLTDAFGDLNMSINSHKTDYDATANAFLTNAALTNFVNASYGGAIIGEKINELQIKYSRSSANALIIYVYGEVVKQFMSKNGVYMISYV